FLLKEIIKATGGKFIFGDPNQPVTGISTDTRSLKKGEVFIALKGKRFDAHNFIAKSVELGTSAVISEKIPDGIDRFFPNMPAIIVVKDTLFALGEIASFYRNKFNCKMICITGSNGKTTTKEMIGSILSPKASSLSSYGNFNNLIGVPLTLLNLKNIHKYCILEFGISLKGEIDRLIEITKPDIGVVTNIGRTHLEFLGNIDGVAKEKKKLLFAIKEGNGYAVLNADDPILLSFIKDIQTNLVTFGIKTGADIMARDITVESEKVSFILLYKGKSQNIKLPIPAKFNVYNALAAAAVGYALGIELDTVKEGLEKFRTLQMRMELIELPSGSVIVNDAYNSNPDSVRNSIENFYEMYPGKKKKIILGDMLELGNSSETEHKSLGEFLRKYDNCEIYLCGKSMSRTADVLKNSKNVIYCNSQEEIIAHIKPLLEETNCAVLLKGSRDEGLEKIIDRLIIY
ncbi:MAG: UDP-N-acetylmuramoyl-tripeptide--D-alanyl-D-alanine ligase, partial [Elusimicrobiota bacterium]